VKQIQIKVYPFLNNTGVEGLAKELIGLILKHCEEKEIKLSKKPKVVLRL
jgi:hypothetical protein